jgi:hypothetical protein
MESSISFRKEVPSRTFTKVYKDYRVYKKPLSVDFRNRCGYCGDYDFWSGGSHNYHIDHFAPKSKFDSLKNVYSNLYCCPYCNIYKSNDWISDSYKINILDGKGYIDPCDKMYDDTFYRNSTGEILYKNDIGKYMYLNLKLHLKRHSIIYKLTTIYELMEDLIKALDNSGLDANSKMNIKNTYFELSLEFNKYLKYLMGEQS